MGSMDSIESSDDETRFLLKSKTQQPKYRRVTVEPALFLYSIYFGGSIPLLQQYVYHKVSIDLFCNMTEFIKDFSDACKIQTDSDVMFYAHYEEQIQRITASWLLFYVVVLLAPCLFTALMLASYSDMAGRKVALIVSIIGSILKCIIIFIGIWSNLHLAFMCIGIFLEGLLGGGVLFYTAAFSYITDISSKEDRAIRIIILEFCAAIAILVSQISVGYLIAAIGFMWPFLILTGILIMDLIYIQFILQEAMPQKADPSKASLFKLNNWKKSFNLYLKDTSDKRCWKLVIILLLVIIFGMAELGRTDISTLYILSSPLCFTSVMIGKYLLFRITVL